MNVSLPDKSFYYTVKLITSQSEGGKRQCKWNCLKLFSFTVLQNDETAQQNRWVVMIMYFKWNGTICTQFKWFRVTCYPVFVQFEFNQQCCYSFTFSCYLDETKFEYHPAVFCLTVWYVRLWLENVKARYGNVFQTFKNVSQRKIIYCC